MAIDERKFKQLKTQAADAKEIRDKAAGQLESTMERLKTEFDCDSVDEAKAKVKELGKTASQAEADYDDAVVKFEEEWTDKLED